MSLLASCPRGALPASKLVQTCRDNWGDIYRLAIKVPEGANPFTGVDVPATITDVETQSAWTDAIALTTTDSLFLTPDIKSFDLVPGEPENFTYPDGDIEVVKVAPATATAILYGMSAENEKALSLLSGGGVDLMFINKDGKTIGKEITVVGGSPFFRCMSIIGSDRAVTTGTDPDRNTVTITFEAGALQDWYKYATEAFAKTI